ncbi:hypothetical protein GCM10023221_04350 [Luteimicrobium xylanilyticum]|uniref:Uncharacterized protein n=1 Tax=Luteimicrobium xylanilyticum TaxID=1133546 RepID=A0A5P9Q887_9MICO|nr:hypothetical protein [Luteimicrobium xylanilyticum]QFU97272.1 hypothetical protein KDY119_00766 [Luteimicrobium xylanilyticum]
MSKHRRRRQFTYHVNPQAVEDAMWRWEEPEPVRSWQEEWATTTLHVVEVVWGDAGWRMYRYDPLRRDDLWDWLLVEAQDLASRYKPKHSMPDPEGYWAAYLHKALMNRSRWHYSSTLPGGRNDAAKAAARDDMKGSIEALLERATPGQQHHIHGSVQPAFGWRPVDPEHFVLTLETIEERGHDPVQKDRDLCTEPGCTKRRTTNGLCGMHYQRWRRDWNTTTCEADGCDRPAVQRNLCTKHNEIRRAQEADPCTVEGCEGPGVRRGLCPKHYARELRARKNTPTPPGGVAA